MDARFPIFENEYSQKFLKYLSAAAVKGFYNSPLPAETRELLMLRASQINGCGHCVDLHTKEGEHREISSVRLHMVAAWREATVFTEAERAAFALVEQGTRIADHGGGVTDEVWDNVVKHWEDDQVAALVGLVAFINAINRINVITRQAGGEYYVGKLSDFF